MQYNLKEWKTKKKRESYPTDSWVMVLADKEPTMMGQQTDQGRYWEKGQEWAFV